MDDSGATQADQPFESVRHPKRRAFLLALVESGGNVRKACELSGVSAATPYTRQWLEDPEFAEALPRAKAMGADMLEAEAVRRAYEGVEEPAGWYKGVPGGTIRKYGDTLLIFLLKGAFPDKYKDRLEFKGLLANIDMEKLPDAAIDRIANGENVHAVLVSLTRTEIMKALPVPSAGA